MAAAGSKCVTIGDVGSGVLECDPQSVWNPRKNCGSFVDAVQSVTEISSQKPD